MFKTSCWRLDKLTQRQRHQPTWFELQKLDSNSCKRPLQCSLNGVVASWISGLSRVSGLFSNAAQRKQCLKSADGKLTELWAEMLSFHHGRFIILLFKYKEKISLFIHLECAVLSSILAHSYLQILICKSWNILLCVLVNRNNVAKM